MRKIALLFLLLSQAAFLGAQTSTFSQLTAIDILVDADGIYAYDDSEATTDNPKRATLTQLLAWLAANDITVTGDWDFNGAVFELPNSATLPGTCDVGDMYMDSDATTGQRFYLCESANNWVLQGDGGGNANSFRFSVTQALHDFSAGQWVMHNDSSNAWELLDSTAVNGDNHAIGFIFSVEDPNTFTLSTVGPESWTHAFDIGPLYASSTPGILTDTAPVLGTVEWLVAVASSSGKIIIMQREWIQL